MSKPTLLILSFSNLSADARLLKQIRLFSERYDVTTCGYGPRPVPGVEHVEIRNGIPKRIARLQGLLLRARRYRSVYWLTPYMRQARRALAGRAFDAVLANDLDTVGVALTIADPDRIHLDLHEFWTGTHDDSPAWVRLRAPYYAWQLRKWARRVRSATTINRPLAQRYEDDYGIPCDVVTNATEFRDFEPTSVEKPIRLVHSGIAQPNRKIERMMRAVAASDSGATLDLYLVGEGTWYYRSLEELSAELGDRITLKAPVPHAALIEALHDFDIGLPFLPPTTTNIRMTLPNKFFDYVQARLGVLTGPTPPMAELVDHYGFGVATEDFSEEALTRAVDALRADTVREWKSAAHRSAEELSAERQSDAWVTAIAAIAGTAEEPK